MGAAKKKPRSTYHHGSLREELLAAALQIVEAEGVAALSLREVARRAGVSPAAPFRHFPDKQALITAIATDALRQFVEQTEQAMEAAGDDPVERFRAMGVAYVEFAVAHPARFRAMCDPSMASLETPELAALRARSEAALRGAVEAGIREGRTPQGDASVVMLAGQAIAYGLARMFVDGMMEARGIPASRARELAIALTDVMGRGVDPRRESAPAAKKASTKKEPKATRTTRKPATPKTARR